MYTHAAAALLAGALAAGAAWQVQGWRYGQQIAATAAQAATAQAQAVQAARAAEQAQITKLQTAQQNAQKNAALAKADADTARRDADSLRHTLAALRLPNEPPAACAARADTTSELLAQCAGAYQELAATADRHVIDKRALMEAWP